MVRSILYNYSDAYILVKGTITVGNTENEVQSLIIETKK